jgi:hypothetical protein
MGTSVLPYLYRFNGVVDTNQPVLQNMESLTSAAGTWLTYDITQGKWAVIINKPTAVTASFDDSNIIGGIQFGSTSLTELYNAVKVTFPRDDLDDQRDFVRAEIPAGDRNANEPDNDLNIDYDILNDPVQAEYLGLLELQQNRLDQTISFVTDYSSLGIRAGDVVEITSAQYGITDYQLRVTSVTEVDDDSGGIQLQIVGVLYNEGIYTPDLNRYERSNQNGLITLNNINQPGNIVTTLYEKDSRPRILANTTVPGNVAIETVELWSSTDNVNYELVGNLPPPGGGTYTTGDTVSFDFDRALTGNVYLKSRALNSSATGPYSNVATIPYTPVQVTDAIGNNTGLLDGAGNSVATLLALQALLKGLDTYMNGDSNLGNAVSGQISSSAGGGLLLGWDVFDSSLTQNNIGTANGTSINGLNEVTSTNSKSFVVPTTGYYLLTAQGNFGKTVGLPDTVGNITILANVYTGNSGGTEVPNSYVTTGWPAYPTEDLMVSGMVYLTTGTYNMRLGYQTEYSNSATFTGSIQGPAVNGWREN